MINEQQFSFPATIKKKIPKKTSEKKQQIIVSIPLIKTGNFLNLTKSKKIFFPTISFHFYLQNNKRNSLID